MVDMLFAWHADPFANDENFLLSMLTLEELGATGNKVCCHAGVIFSGYTRLQTSVHCVVPLYVDHASIQAGMLFRWLTPPPRSCYHIGIALSKSVTGTCALTSFAMQGLVGITSNPVLANGIAGLATSATAQATVEVRHFQIGAFLFLLNLRVPACC